MQHASYDYRTLRDVIRDDDIPMEDRMEAVNEMEQMAEDGDIYAQYLMGKLWRDSPLLIPNAVNARYWFDQAARQEHLVAQYSLAKLYLSDDIVYFFYRLLSLILQGFEAFSCCVLLSLAVACCIRFFDDGVGFVSVSVTVRCD